MRVLVTGADGFVGRHLCRHLVERGDEVHALTGLEQALPASLGVRFQRAIDVLNPGELANALAAAAPEGVVHLAGFSSVGKSFAHAGQAYAVNTLGTVNLLEAARAHAPKARVLAVSSGEVYGPVPAGSAADELCATLALSPYSGSKLAAEIACQQAARAGLQVSILRPFNHLGRGQAQSFVVPAFAQQLAMLGRARAEPVIRVGDLSPVRDFSHVDDVVEAYRLLLERAERGEVYNIASGSGRSIQQLLDEMIALTGLTVKIEPDPARMRPSEIPYLVGDASKLRRLGWNPSRSVTSALGEVLAEAREAAG